MTLAPTYTTSELLAVLLARELDDEAVGILGTRSEVGYAACRLAQATTAPGLWFISGPSGVVNPSVDAISPIADYALFAGAEALSDLTDNIDAIDWSHRFFDFAILGGLQVDRFGNLNTVAVGDWSHPKVRGPGPIGASVLAAHARRFYIVMPDHSTRSFRPVVDFVSALGFGRTGTERAALGLPGGGPVLLLSPLGSFDYTPDSHEMRVRTLHPGVSLAQVQDATGFTVHAPDRLPETTPPTEHELILLRETIDRTRALI
jgi:glutaconate CoA-transferase subunit B